VLNGNIDKDSST